jgi:hypothetical protein
LENNQISVRNGEKMLKKTITVLFALTILLTACGPEATPTMSPADVQGTAVAAAWTVVAETQAAIPTATPLPPTPLPSPTLQPTFTPPPLATSGVATQNPVAALPTSTSASADSCLMPLDMGEAGPKKRVRVENDTGGPLNLSLTLYEKNAFGQCGALSWANVGKNAKFIIEIPSGSWFAYAWITLPGGGSSESAGSFFLGPSKTDDLLRLIVKKDVIGIVGP